MKTRLMEIHDIAVFSKDSKVHKTPAVSVEAKAPIKKLLKTQELELFARTLSGLLEGGVSILKALESLERASASKESKSVLMDVQESIRRGVSFSKALERSQRVPAFFYQTVYAGEVSGCVPKVLNELSEYMRKEQALKSSIRDALVYPVFILLVGFVTLGVLTCFVLPKLEVVYEGFGSELPLITRFILGVSRLFLPMAGLLLASGAYLATYAQKKKLELLLHKIPFLENLFGGFVRVRFSRLIWLLLESGIPILDALDVVEKTFSSSLIKRDVLYLKSSLAAGNGFSDCLDQVRWMDAFSRMLIISGEETGRLAAAFSQIARDTQLQLEAKISLLVKLLEPGLILVIGVSVGFVVIGTVLPIFDMSGIVR